MFTGIITNTGVVMSVITEGARKRLRVACTYPAETIDIGASIATGGPCLTVITRSTDWGVTWYDVDVGAETLARTTAGSWVEGTKLNLERALKIGDELGGHIVTGHIDGIAKIVAAEPFDGMTRFTIAAPKPLARFIAEKGSVALDGTSLTVNSVSGNEFSVLLIPHTLAVTTWGDREVGDELNLEVDLMARYAARLMAEPPA